MQTADIGELSRFVPGYVLGQIEREEGTRTAPTHDEFSAAVLFSDITGFTKLSDEMAKRGAGGFEELARILNAYFGRLIEIIQEHGGDVLKFAGDALLAWWPAEDEAALARVVQAAAQCAWRSQEALRSFSAGGGAAQLSQRVGVGAGSVRVATLGGVFSRWEMVAYGEAVTEATKAAAVCAPGEAVAGPCAWGRLQSLFTGTVLEADGTRLVEQREPVQAAALQRPVLPQTSAPALLPFLPAAIRTRLAARQSGWLAEWRRLTVIFLNMPELNSALSLETMQTAMRSLQEGLYRFEGSVNKLSVDDKGVTLVAALGLPPLAHEDDPVRGVRAALSLRDRLGEMGWRGSVGVTTGWVFCGTVGCATRCEYTVVGAVVNLSARLMQAAGDGILCDAETWEAARGKIEFEALPAIKVKGKAEPVPVYRPLGEARFAPASDVSAPMFGRTGEQRIMREALAQLVLGGAGGVMLVEGEAGVGKSRLMQCAVEQAGALGLRVLAGRADAIERSTSYYGWREIFRGLLEPEPAPEERAPWSELLTPRLRAVPDGERLAPLLNVVLSERLPENEWTQAMSQEARVTSTNALLSALLGYAATVKPLVVILEDGHWLDSASLSLARDLALQRPRLMFILASRPPAEPVAREYAQIKASPRTVFLPLGPLEPEEAIGLVCQRLGVRALPAAASSLISARAQGNPFFAEELAYALRDSGMLQISEGECRIAPDRELAGLNLPETVQGVVTSRIDRLGPNEQLTLKVASVIGHVFSCRLLGAIFPIKDVGTRWLEDLETLRHLSLTLLETPEPDQAYAFRHATTQEVAYHLIPPAQRSQLHRSVAEWYETVFAGRLQGHYPLLAKHWSSADDPAKALDYLEKSARDALRNSANAEVVRFLQQALAIDREKPGHVDDFKRAGWRRLLGEAYYGLGDQAHSVAEFRECLRLLKHPMPATPVRQLLGALGQACMQAVHRLLPAKVLAWFGGSRASDLEAARAYERVAQIMYMDNAKMPTIHGAFKALNLAEPHGPSPELARTLASVAIVAGVLRMHPYARENARRSRAIAEQLQEPGCTAFINFHLGVYFITVGSWAKADHDLRISVHLAQQTGERRRWLESDITLVHVDLRCGRMRPALDRSAVVEKNAREWDMPPGIIWGLCYQLWVQQIVADEPAAEAALRQRLTDCLAAHPEVPLADQILGYGILAWAQWRRGEIAMARQSASRAEEILRQTDQIAHYLTESFGSLYQLWEAEIALDPSNVETRDEMRSKLRLITRLLSQFSKMYPFGECTEALYRGRLHREWGQEKRAVRAWQEGVASAQFYGLAHIEGLLCTELARSAHLAAPDRKEYEWHARQLFKLLGADRDLRRLEELLGK